MKLLKAGAAVGVCRLKNKVIFSASSYNTHHLYSPVVDVQGEETLSSGAAVGVSRLKNIIIKLLLENE